MKIPFPLSRSLSLSNGIPIISNPQHGPFNAIGLLLRKGSSSEHDHELGINYILSKVLTKHTAKKNEGQLFKFLEEHCATIVPNFSKDFSLLTVGFLPSKLQDMLYLLSEIVAEPLVSDADIEECAKISAFELMQEQKLHPEMLISDWTHYRAFGQRGLGNALPIFASKIRDIAPVQVCDYLKKQLTCDNVLLAGSGVKEEEFVKYAENAFSFIPPSTSPAVSTTDVNEFQMREKENSSSVESFSLNPNAETDYVGGQISLPNHQPETNDFTRISVAFPSVPITNPNAYAFAVANSLLGGGSSFSSGGPGKGMYSRLYTQVLNNYHWAECAQAFNFAYKSAGLFGIHGACNPGNAYKMLSVFYNQLSSIGDVNEVELSRAKNQLKSSIMMGLETRIVQVENLARQLDAHAEVGRAVKITEPDEICSKIDAVSVHNLKQVSRHILNKAINPTVVLIQSKKECDDISASTIESLHSKYSQRVQKSFLSF